MNTRQAQHLLADAGKLVQLSATFTARYGRHYELRPDSPEDAWKLYDAIQAIQAEIVAGLDDILMMKPHHRCGKWWERHDVIDLSTAQAISHEVSNLIACCAAHEANAPGSTAWSYAIQNAQLAIAGMLHPAAIQVGEAAREAS